jgi:hypothetical protein
LKVTVQNGTDTAGYAKEIGDYMEEKGYRNVVRENADVDTYTDTIIKIKEGKRNYLSLVLSDLKDKFLLATASTLDATASSDVVLILGKK